MDPILVFDIDGTLTTPRQPINYEMTQVLNNLKVPFYVAAGSHFSLLENQFFNPLYHFGFRKKFDAFVSNGAIHYSCDYSFEKSIKLISEFNIRAHLGETDYSFLIGTLEKTLKMDKYLLPPDLNVIDNRIVDRSSMINMCPMGRMATEDSSATINRRKFVEFDKENKYREKIMIHLNNILNDIIKRKNLHITLGGQTSFDIGIAGEDKTKPIRLLIKNNNKKIVFIGDALFQGGNDAAINDYIKSWPASEECPVIAIQVGMSPSKSWEDTIEVLAQLNVL